MTAATLKALSNRFPARPLMALAGCVLTGALGIANAAPSSNTEQTARVPQVVVSYGDLNLATDQGTRTLYRRISDAARHVCPLEDGRNLALTASSNTCRTEAVARAVRDINSPQLAALAAGIAHRG